MPRWLDSLLTQARVRLCYVITKMDTQDVLTLILNALYAAAGMLWNILWALLLGFILSGIIITFVPKGRMSKFLGHAGAKELALATILGSVSSSCSYAATTMAKNLFQKGAHFITALAFMLASTNLVIELSAVIWIMLGRSFVLAELLGGILLVVIMALLAKILLPAELIEKIRRQNSELKNGRPAKATMGDKAANPLTREGWQRVAASFIAESQMIWKDVVLGLVISGFLMVCVPATFWQSLFLPYSEQVRSGNQANVLQLWPLLENALMGPLVSMASFVCSVGNIPLASLLYHDGVSFGGTLSFIYADLIIVPLILIYKKYYGTKVALLMTGIFYIAMTTTGILIELLFYSVGWLPARAAAPPSPRPFGSLTPPGRSTLMHEMIFFKWNYTAWLNISFLLLTAFMFWLARSSKNQSASGACCH